MIERYKRPIVTTFGPIKIVIVMGEPAGFGSPSQGGSPWKPFLSAIRLVEKKGCVLFRNCRKRKWIWITLIVLGATESYFVRELIVAFFFFTILYVILAALVVLYILLVDVLDYGTLWLESFGRSVLSLAHHRFASPARLPSATKDQTLHKLGHG